MTKIFKKPTSEIENFNTKFYVISSLKVGWTYAFLNKPSSDHPHFKLPEDLRAPREFHGHWCPDLSIHDEFVLKEFGFEPKSYLCIDTWKGNRDLSGSTKRGIETYLALTKRENAETIISRDLGSIVYCSSLDK